MPAYGEKLLSISKDLVSQGFYKQNGKQIEVVTTAAVGGNVITDENENVLEIAGVGSLELSEHRSGLRIVSGMMIFFLTFAVVGL